MSKIEHILSVIHYTICGAVCFQFTNFFVMIERIYILCLIIIKSEVWAITHCLGLGHETMVCAVCLSIFFFIFLACHFVRSFIGCSISLVLARCGQSYVTWWTGWTRPPFMSASLPCWLVRVPHRHCCPSDSDVGWNSIQHPTWPSIICGCNVKL